MRCPLSSSPSYPRPLSHPPSSTLKSDPPLTHLDPPPRSLPDGNEALAFLKTVQASVDKPETQEAYLLATTEAAHFSLLLGDLATVQSSLNAASKILDSMDNVPSIVHASFYRVFGDLYKSKAEYKGYYKNSLLFLACIDIESDLSKEERVSRAHDLGELGRGGGGGGGVGSSWTESQEV